MKHVQIKRKTVLFFVKHPEAGPVKTRLAKSVGKKEAARLYCCLVEHNWRLLQTCRGTEVSLIVAYDPVSSEDKVAAWLPSADGYFAQEGAGLGERLSCACENAFRRGAGKVLVLGSDTIGLRCEQLEKTFCFLDETDVILGPVEDGGYYLIGLRSFLPGFFDEIPWSSGSVLETTLSRIRQFRLLYRLLEPLRDLDESKDISFAESELNHSIITEGR